MSFLLDTNVLSEVRKPREQFVKRTLPVTSEIAEAWGRLNAERLLPAVDGLMAATAVVHDLTLVTRNVRDVEGTGARTLNPFVH